MAPSGWPIDDQYVITVRGVAGPAVRAAFADLQVTALDQTTILGGTLLDQAALPAVLQRIQNLGLDVIDVRRQPQPQA
jgi:hypothetical protein